jgi:hypothetical protein
MSELEKAFQRRATASDANEAGVHTVFNPYTEFPGHSCLL